MGTPGELERLAGQVIIGGFEGTAAPLRFAEALEQGLRAGVILFRRNLPDITTAAELSRVLYRAEHEGLRPFISIDQEGGRVRRLDAPLLELPPMRVIGDRGDVELAVRLATACGRELAALGFNLNFAPILDVDSNPANPIIGDRSFSRDPERVAELGLAWADGLRRAGIIPCGKHFPGHGDTALDSHLDLPRLPHDLERLRQLELLPFRRAAEADLESIMSAHILFEALDEAVPGTLSPKIITGLLRNELGFRGLVFSDCLEMKAISDRYDTGDAAVRAIRAGVDVLLICHTWERQEAALDAIAREAARDAAFAERLTQAAERSRQLRQKYAPQDPATEAELTTLLAEHAPLRQELETLGDAS